MHAIRGRGRAELTRAHEIAAARYGKDDRRTKRIAEVLESVQQHVVAAPAAGWMLPRIADYFFSSSVGWSESTSSTSP